MEISIDTHSFIIESNDLYQLHTDIEDIQDILVNYTISDYTSSILGNRVNINISSLIKHIENNDSDNFFLYHIYYNNNIVNPLFNISIYKTNYGTYTITFNFYSLTQYNRHIPTLTTKCLDRRRLYKSILGHMLNEDISVTHKRIDICVDILDIDFNNLTIISETGKYRKPDIVEKNNKNLYSREREIYKSKDGYKHVYDRVAETTQMVLNVYDKSNKGEYEYNMVRIEYKLYKRGIRSIVSEDNIDVIRIKKLLDRYSVLHIENVNRTMKRYINKVEDMNVIKRRVAGDAMISKYGIYDCRDDVKNAILEMLSIGRYTHEE